MQTRRIPNFREDLRGISGLISDMAELLHSLGIEWHILIAQIINFAILLAVLAKFVYKPVLQMIDERREGTLRAIEREEHASTKLARAETDREAIIAEAHQESARVIEASRQTGEDLKKRLTADAKAEIAKSQASAEKKLKEDKVRLFGEVKAEIGTLVVTTIEQTLGDVLDPRTQGKMVEQALAAIRESNG
ncbi:MAG: ATP synthase F0 subunit B, partial [Candidatus Taylorbacteria bacterium CG11_big_fil_rev_8_21_14_0_20_46_11]